jgi:hypothetical protein
MSTFSLSSGPNLEFYRKQAKALLKAGRAGDGEAASRFRRCVPRLSDSTGPLPLDIALHDAQLTIARENHFDSWPLFRAHLIGVHGASPKRFRPHVRGFQWYEERVAGILSVHKSGLSESLATIRNHHPRFTNASDDEIRAETFTQDDARLVLAREHGFASWEEFKAYVDAIQRGEQIEPFTLAFEAIKAGDIAAVAALLGSYPDLLEAQGTNGSSLLNLAVSLKQPAICRLLIDSGADVDLGTTRGVRPLHTAAYGNNVDLIELLIQAGASLEACAYGDGGTPLVMALFWGHDEAREALARHAIVPNNLRVAAGVGRLDLVQSCFHGGELTADAIAHRVFYRPHTGFPIWIPSEAAQEVKDEALVYAARNGQVSVLGFLLSMGADINADPYRGTALIWAVNKGRINVVRWLLDHGADINRRATFGGPTHGQGYTALHAAAENGNLDLAKFLVARGADPDIKDDLHHGPPWGWAEYHEHPDVMDYLRSLAST